MTQLKAYFIALGGELSFLQASRSIFDKIIFQNFQTHLMLTLLSNHNLTQAYPHYAYFMGMVPTPSQLSQQQYSNEVLNQLSQQDRLGYEAY